jgi:type IV pilus assembly protein PilM
MAVKTVWGVDVGTTALKALRLRLLEDGKVCPEGHTLIEYPQQLDYPDCQPSTVLTDAVRQFVDTCDIAVGEQVAINFSSSSSMARFLSPPPLDATKLSHVMQHEAKQQIPFSLDDVNWDWQLLSQMKDDIFVLESECVIQSAKKDQVEEAVSFFKKAGIRIRLVQANNVALVNALDFELGLSEAFRGRDKLGDKEDFDSLPYYCCVGVGAATSDLVIADGRKIWLRSIPLGGTHFTKQLAKELKLTFAKAEHLKRNVVEAEDAKAVIQAMRPVFNDLLTEIQRSLGFYSNINRRSTMEKFVVTGGGMLLPGLALYLGKNLGYETCVWNEYDNMTPNPQGLEWSPQRFRVAYGLALQQLGLCWVETNLLGKRVPAFSPTKIFGGLKRLIPRVRITWDR